MGFHVLVVSPTIWIADSFGTSIIPLQLILGLEEVSYLVKGKLGKTYHCDICGQEVSVTKEGVGVLVCCNKPMREM